MNDQTRQEFEAWFAEFNGGGEKPKRDPVTGDYKNAAAIYTWLAWQAARGEWIEIAVHGEPPAPEGRCDLYLVTMGGGSVGLAAYMGFSAWLLSSGVKIGPSMPPTHYRALPAPAHNGEYRA